MRENLSLANLNTCTRTCVHVGCHLFVYIPHRAIARHALLPLSTTPSSRLKNFSSSASSPSSLHSTVMPSSLHNRMSSSPLLLHANMPDANITSGGPDLPPWS